MNARKIALVLLLVSLSLAGCKGKSSLVASVNGRDISQAEFDAYLKLKHLASPDSKRRAAALDEYVERSAMAAVIEKEGKLDKLAIDTEVEEYRKELLISRYFDQYLGDKVSEEAIKNFYDTHAANYEQRKVHVAHILVRTQPKMSDAEKQAKRTTIQEVASKLQSGQSFEELAKAVSEDRISGAKGGDLGWLREGSIDPEFSKRAFSGKAGVTSEPFETAFGFHILKVLEEPKVARKPYAAAVGDIRYQLRAEAKAAEVKRLNELAKIKKYLESGDTQTAPSASAVTPQAAPGLGLPHVLPPPELPEEPALGIPQPNPIAPNIPGTPPMQVQKSLPAGAQAAPTPPNVPPGKGGVVKTPKPAAAPRVPPARAIAPVAPPKEAPAE